MRFTSIVNTAILASTLLALPNNGLWKRNDQLDDWAGVAIAAPPADQGGFVTVIGTFVVPTIDTSTTPMGSAVSLWVGIDGYMPLTPPVIQAGVDVEYASDGTMIYTAWTEWYPDGTEVIGAEDFKVSPGDTITVQVSGQPGSAEADVIFTNSAGDRFETPIAPSDDTEVIQGNNIEWVIERLPGEGNTAPSGQLLNFGTITFSACAGSTAQTAASSFPKDGTAIDMLNGNGGVAASTVVDTSGDGDSFTVTWVTG